MLDRSERIPVSDGLRLRAPGYVLVAVLAVLGALVLAPERARACSCMQQTQRDAYEQAVAVFEGHVLEVKPPEGEPGVGSATVRLKVVQAWKGTESEEVVLITPANSAACGYNFTPGQSYLVYAGANEGKLEVSLCSRTQPSADAGEDMSALGLGATPVEVKTEPPAAAEREPSQKEPPARGGCAGCALGGANAAPRRALLALALGGLLLITCRRRSGSRS